MKNLLMILILLSGFAVSEAVAQSCKPANCTPCPPGCCIINCCTSKSAAASVHTGQTNEAVLASLMLENQNTDLKACKMSRKEMKACMAACKATSASTATTTPTPGCLTSPACKTTTTVAVSPTVQKVSLQKS